MTGPTLELSQRIPTVDANSFDALVTDAVGPVAIEFMSYGCAHCRAIEPVLQRVAERLAGSEHVLRVNVAAEHELADRFEIRVTPTLVMFLDGAEVGRVEGPRPQFASLMTTLTQPFERNGGMR